MRVQDYAQVLALLCLCWWHLVLAKTQDGLLERLRLRSPFERVKMDLVLHRKQGAISTARQIMRHEGLLAFWHGNGLNVLRTAPFKVQDPS